MIVGAVALVSVFVFIVAFMALLLVGAARIFTLPLNYPATVTVVGIAFGAWVAKLFKELSDDKQT